MKAKKAVLAMAISSVTLGVSSVSNADTFTDALTSGTASGDIRIRYESAESGDVDSDQLSIRTRLGYKTGDVGGFSAFLEFEDVTNMLGVDDEESLIPDPEVTEVDQAFIQYKSGGVTAKLGAQVITLDGHRHVGHVGWRQDRQTFDAFRVQYAATDDLSFDFTHIYQRNRIFGESLDVDSNDFLLNVGYKTPIGKATVYGYMLDDEGRNEASDTFGASLVGKTGSEDLMFHYAIEIASQSITDDVDLSTETEFDTDYSLLELGLTTSGITAKIGMETLGSDDGQASFTTPLATLHKFNGWADVFLGGTFNPTAMPAGLEDTYLSVSGMAAGLKLVAAYHLYSANEGDADYGDEINLLVAKKFNKTYSGGIKYAAFSPDEGDGDVNKIWLWVGAKF